MKNLLLMAAAAMALSACSAGPGGPGGAFGNRAERPRLDPIGDPGRVASVDLVFSRTARDEGQWSAFRRFAASDAILHFEDGPIQAAQWLSGRQDPAESVRWGPKDVWSSCDGSLSVTFGRFEEPDGTVGSYTTVWQLQRDGDYRWVYDMGAADSPQPPPRPPAAEPDEDTIIVSGLAAIEGRVADCARGDSSPPPPPPVAPATSGEAGGGVSRDSTLSWRWAHEADGTRAVTVDFLRNGEWQQALDFTVGPAED